MSTKFEGLQCPGWQQRLRMFRSLLSIWGANVGHMCLLCIRQDFWGFCSPVLHGNQVGLSAPLVMLCWVGLCGVGITEFVVVEVASTFACLSLGL